MDALGTNPVTSERQADEVHQLLPRVEAILSYQDAEVLRIQKSLREAICTRDELRKLVGSTKAVVSPARRLPAELWVQIFRECLPPVPRMRAADAPLLVSQVCRPWRQLALSSPLLWSTLEIRIPDQFYGRDEPDSGMCKLAKEWLHRSAHCPLSITLIVPFFAHCAVTALLWRTIAAHKSRWRRLSLRLPDSWVQSLLTSWRPKSLPLLESLSIEITYANTIQPCRFAFDTHCASRLSYFKVIGLPSAESNLKLNWAQLREVALQPPSGWEVGRFYSLNETLDILSQGTQLKSLSLFVEAYVNEPTRAPTTVRSNIERLHIRVRHTIPDGHVPTEPCAAKISTFLNSLALPHLRDFKFQCEWGLDCASWPQAAFVSLLFRTSSTLRVLAFSALPIPEGELIECLRRVPSLTHLLVSIYPAYTDPVGDRLLRALTAPPAREAMCLLPLLEAVDLQRCGRGCTDAAILDLLESRMQSSTPHRGVTRLKSFQFTMWRPLSELLRSAAAVWSQRGRDVVILGRL